MNFVQFAKMAVMTGLVMAAMWSQPQMARADEIVAPSNESGAICNGVTVLAWARVDGTSSTTDDVVVDGTIITAESSDTTGTTGDPEWRYTPVRR